MNNLKYRYESYGGIIASDNPPLLAHVDKNYMLELGFKKSVLWKSKRKFLTAPLEVHLSVTNKCPLKCRSCYMDSGKALKNELSTKEIKKVLDMFAQMKVFHVALGGGESFARKDFFELANYARAKGLVPNLTTNGYYINKKTAQKCRVFGQVNVSIDGIGSDYKKNRGVDFFSRASNAVKLLKEASVPVGINCVISKTNFNKIESIVRYAGREKLQDIEFLRFKPAGRGKNEYFKMKLDSTQNKKLYPLLLKLSKKYDINIKIDCSFVPMLCYHNPPKKDLELFSVYGCEAGNVLVGVEADGKMHGCSFLRNNNDSIMNLQKAWDRIENFNNLRTWIARAPDPCSKCSYLDLCKGGCHAVAEFVTGDLSAPDPECPKVEEKKAKNKE
ncbi:MAG: hypothetical protein A2252_12375 [Elusimicrobia bacterium RIFOXYA2_FULL_39_19]|nr:MAG: hypothetical protein A2252_12375 [Elusimicrobia bacterium RIFOXYA2_FULL_39_19]